MRVVDPAALGAGSRIGIGTASVEQRSLSGRARIGGSVRRRCRRRRGRIRTDRAGDRAEAGVTPGAELAAQDPVRSASSASAVSRARKATPSSRVGAPARRTAPVPQHRDAAHQALVREHAVGEAEARLDHDRVEGAPIELVERGPEGLMQRSDRARLLVSDGQADELEQALLVPAGERRPERVRRAVVGLDQHDPPELVRGRQLALALPEPVRLERGLRGRVLFAPAWRNAPRSSPSTCPVRPSSGSTRRVSSRVCSPTRWSGSSRTPETASIWRRKGPERTALSRPGRCGSSGSSASSSPSGVGAIAGPGRGPRGGRGQLAAELVRAGGRVVIYHGVGTFVMRGQRIEGASPTSGGRCASAALRHPVVRSFRVFERRCLRPASLIPVLVLACSRR